MRSIPIWGVLCVIGGFLFHLALGYFYTVGMCQYIFTPSTFRQYEYLRHFLHEYYCQSSFLVLVNNSSLAGHVYAIRSLSCYKN